MPRNAIPPEGLVPTDITYRKLPGAHFAGALKQGSRLVWQCSHQHGWTGSAKTCAEGQANRWPGSERTLHGPARAPFWRLPWLPEIRLSGNQELILRTLARLAENARNGVVQAREVAAALSQGTDGPAYTLRSLVQRSLVANGHFADDCYGYTLTEAGTAWLEANPR